ncbi:hypothetical protein [Plantactinospora sp. GCM10030261]|uniref:hypothetical protein n=1 Tax=Plantactinospora sp. GCM10030261 TaxID=3273420 RepID=UPI00360AF1D8
MVQERAGDPRVVPLDGLDDPPRRARLLRRAAALRTLSIALVSGAVGSATWWASLVVRDGSAARRVWLVVAVVFVGLLVAALLAFAAARVTRREAAERLSLVGDVLRVTERGGTTAEYDLGRVPVSLRLRSLMSVTDPRPVWAELVVGADELAAGRFRPARVLPLSDMTTRRLRPADELSALADAVGRSSRPEARVAAARIRTMIKWGSLVPLRGTSVDDIPPASP